MTIFRNIYKPVSEAIHPQKCSKGIYYVAFDFLCISQGTWIPPPPSRPPSGIPLPLSLGSHTTLNHPHPTQNQPRAPVTQPTPRRRYVSWSVHCTRFKPNPTTPSVVTSGCWNTAGTFASFVTPLGESAHLTTHPYCKQIDLEISPSSLNRAQASQSY